jgi:hypothetical protein
VPGFFTGATGRWNKNDSQGNTVSDNIFESKVNLSAPDMVGKAAFTGLTPV